MTLWVLPPITGQDHLVHSLTGPYGSLSSPPRRACCPSAACLHLSLRPFYPPVPPLHHTCQQFPGSSLLLKTPLKSFTHALPLMGSPHHPFPQPQNGCRNQLFQTPRGCSWGSCLQAPSKAQPLPPVLTGVLATLPAILSLPERLMGSPGWANLNIYPPLQAGGSMAEKEHASVGLQP